MACGILTPFISSVTTGMPPAMMLPQMMVELAVYGLVAGLCEKYISQKNEMTKLYMSLIIAMLAGRIVNGLVNTCILSTQGYTLSVFMRASFVTCLPGVILQLIVIPVLVRSLNKNIYKQPEKVLAE
ncbi:ECF transporter S component [Holdemanella porci]|uniref:ECF transporter S component n=1 Tax=Holdemanella porci TaxID=2652276 RepID=UPI003F937637